MEIQRAYPTRDHRVGLKEESYQGVIKVGDNICASYLSSNTFESPKYPHRTGVIKLIRIAMDDHDVAAENDTGVDVNSYDTRLEYQGSVTYGDFHWCYLNQIIRKG